LPAGCPLSLRSRERLPSFGAALGEGLLPNLKPGVSFDDRGDHVFACKSMYAATFSRHQRICGGIASIARAAGCEATLEPSALNRLSPSRGSLRRPGDVTIVPLDGRGTVVAVDATVRCARAVKGAAAAESDKFKSYASFFSGRPGALFFPFAVTVEGEAGPSARRFCARMASMLALSKGSGLNLSSAWRCIRARLCNAFALAVGEQIVHFEQIFRGASPPPDWLPSRGSMGGSRGNSEEEREGMIGKE
jgi:hypothetical protein